jgi:hypothetical protein
VESPGFLAVGHEQALCHERRIRSDGGREAETLLLSWISGDLRFRRRDARAPAV